MITGTTNLSSWTITRGRQLIPAPFLIAGIVNITPDSFSDGGQYLVPEQAVDHAIQLAEQGAHILDFGAESTRPGAKDIGTDEEQKRLAPVLTLLRKKQHLLPKHTAISIDTFRAETAKMALTMGADIINDVSGTAFDHAMIDVLAEFTPGYVLGHSPAMPQTMQSHAQYDNVVDTLLAHFTSTMNTLVKRGLPESNICLDPCIGFGKTAVHARDIFQGIDRLRSLGRPLYFGISRKSFIGTLTGLNIEQRSGATQIGVALLASQGVHIHRVHEVAATQQTLALVAALGYTSSTLPAA